MKKGIRKLLSKSEIETTIQTFNKHPKLNLDLLLGPCGCPDCNFYMNAKHYLYKEVK
jgi:hypothetical protein